MGKSSKRYQSGDFSRKKREMNETEDLDKNGYMDMISNKKRIKQNKDKYYDND
tara:strand:+ start:265 stop:423 length:159 start_codon:yes stop_codon:yes gene_type:complete